MSACGGSNDRDVYDPILFGTAKLFAVEDQYGILSESTRSSDT